MVERLKQAIEKARAQREQALVSDPVARATTAPAPAGTVDWSMLSELAISESRLAANRVISQQCQNPLHRAYDVLRTRLLTSCTTHGWRRIGVTSATKRCGKTLTVVNLAFSLARHPRGRTIVLDVDLRAPHVANTLGVAASTSMADLLLGTVAPHEALMRVGTDVAFGLNRQREPNSAELFQRAETARSMARLMTEMQPDLMLFDMPPLLIGDDALAALSLVDAVLLIAAAGETTAAQIEECERIIGTAVPLAGVVLNRCETAGSEAYGYDYEAV